MRKATNKLHVKPPWFNPELSCLLYKKGQFIFSENNRVEGLFWICKGKVLISKTGGLKREQIIRFVNEGNFIGCHFLLHSTTYSVSAKTLEDSHICFIDGYTFFKFQEHLTGFSMAIMYQLTADIKDVELNITKMAQKSVRERTAEVLLSLETFYGMKEDGNTINMSLKRNEIANTVGSATESVSRVLSDFKEK
ncbi:MAG: Crp/Fnr family transcriptional regulator, partial [Candidatus Paceibacterota bacterium]